MDPDIIEPSAMPLTAEASTITDVTFEPADSELADGPLSNGTNLPQLQNNLSPAPKMTMDKQKLFDKNMELRRLLQVAEHQINTDHAQK